MNTEFRTPSDARLQNFDERDFIDMYLTNILISLWLLNQIGWGFRLDADN